MVSDHEQNPTGNITEQSRADQYYLTWNAPHTKPVIYYFTIINAPKRIWTSFHTKVPKVSKKDTEVLSMLQNSRPFCN